MALSWEGLPELKGASSEGWGAFAKSCVSDGDVVAGAGDVGDVGYVVLLSLTLGLEHPARFGTTG